MTNPPTEPPPDGWPPPPHGWPPPGWPYDPSQPHPGWRPPRKSSGQIFGAAASGIFLYFAINFVMGFGLWLAAGYPPKTAVFVTGAVVFALIAFGGGAALLALHKPWAKGLGLGLMIGWALTSIFTVGICTGLNPWLYHQGTR
jgi:hypothetical protein